MLKKCFHRKQSFFALQSQEYRKKGEIAIVSGGNERSRLPLLNAKKVPMVVV